MTHIIDGWNLGLTPCERSILSALYDAGGHTVTHSDLHAAVRDGSCTARGDYHKMTGTYVYRIRSKLPGAYGKIVSDYKVGYSFERNRGLCDG